MSGIVTNSYRFAGTPEQLLSQTSGTHSANFNYAPNLRIVTGWYIGAGSLTTAGNSAVGKTLTDFTVRLKKLGAYSGTIAYGVWATGSNTTTTPTTTFTGATTMIGDLGLSFADYANTGSHVLSVGDVIGVSQVGSTTTIMACEQEYNGNPQLPVVQDIDANGLSNTTWWFDSGYENNGVATVE